MIEMEDNEAQMVNSSGHTSRNYWLPLGKIQANRIGEYSSSKTVIWRRNVFISQGKKAECAIDYSFVFNKTIFEVTENEFADPIFILTKIVQHAKAYRLIDYKLLEDTKISIKNLTLFLEVHPRKH